MIYFMMLSPTELLDSDVFHPLSHTTPLLSTASDSLYLLKADTSNCLYHRSTYTSLYYRSTYTSFPHVCYLHNIFRFVPTVFIS